MSTRFVSNVNAKKKSVLIQGRSTEPTIVAAAVARVLNKVEEDIVNDRSTPTTTQLTTIARVLVQLETRNVDPIILLLCKTCLNLVTKYKLTADKLVTTLNQLELAQFKASLVDDIEKVKAYLLNRGATVFPTQHVSVQQIEVSEAVAIHIQKYGLPIQLTTLAMIEENLQNASLTLPGTLISMIQQFVEAFT